MPLIKSRLLDTALTSYQNLSNNWGSPENQTPPEIKTSKHLPKSKSIFIHKVGKGNIIVTLGKCSYISVIEEILTDKGSLMSLLLGRLTM